MLHRWGVKIGMEKWTLRATIRVYDPRNWTFYCDFTKSRNINAPQERILCAIFTKFAAFVPLLQDALTVKIWMDLLKGLRSYGGFKLRVSSSPKFSAPPSRETVRRTPKVLEVQERARGSRFCGVRIEFFVCLFVCPSRCWTLSVCRCTPGGAAIVIFTTYFF